MQIQIHWGAEILHFSQAPRCFPAIKPYFEEQGFEALHKILGIIIKGHAIIMMA